MIIKDIIPTHNTLRDFSKVDEFQTFLTKNHLVFDNTYSLYAFEECSHKIALNQCEDGKVYCMDGHHRIVALMSFNIDRLVDYNSTFYKYNHLLELNKKSISNKWITPFDPRVDCRKADYEKWRTYIIKNIGDEYTKARILRGYIGNSYKVPRKIHSFQDLYYQYLHYKMTMCCTKETDI